MFPPNKTSLILESSINDPNILPGSAVIPLLFPGSAQSQEAVQDSAWSERATRNPVKRHPAAQYTVGVGEGCGAGGVVKHHGGRGGAGVAGVAGSSRGKWSGAKVQGGQALRGGGKGLGSSCLPLASSLSVPLMLLSLP